MRKIILLVATLLVMACGVTQPLTQSQLAQKPLPTLVQRPTDTIQIVPTEIAKEIITATENYNLRYSVGGGQSLGILYAGMQAEIIITATNADGSAWALVQTVEEDPLDVLTGWVNLGCCR
ncbi:MAG: hypothetical protein HOJ31_10400 [Anaerolineae bacterium]|jgi:hypothetical protein|nr:hypothetical protein [Anaerolineae bacterium]